MQRHLLVSVFNSHRFRPLKNADVSGNVAKNNRVGRSEINFFYGVISGFSVHFALTEPYEVKNFLCHSCYKIFKVGGLNVGSVELPETTIYIFFRPYTKSEAVQRLIVPSTGPRDLFSLSALRQFTHGS
jgi:hypothetical protein